MISVGENTYRRQKIKTKIINMKIFKIINTVIVSILVIFLLFVIIICVGNWRDNMRYKRNETVIDRKCQQELINFFQLQPICTDWDYYTRLKGIYNDTLVLCTSCFNGKTSTNRGYYLFQSLKNPKFKKYIDAKSWFVSCSPIDYYKDGYLYGGAFGQSYMERIGIDGSYKKYFTKYNDTLFYANQTFFYEDLTVVVSMNGIFVFDREKEKLLWEHRYLHDNTELAVQLQLNKNFIFVERVFPALKNRLSNLFFTCLDLKTLKVKWKKKYSYNSMFWNEEYRNSIPTNNKNEIMISTENGIDVLNATNGNIVWNYKFNKPKSLSLRSYIDSTNVYYIENDTLNCFNFNQDRLNWKTPQKFTHYYPFRNYIIGFKNDSLFLVNKNNGATDKSISCLGQINFNPIDKYVLIDTTFYK